MKRIYFNNLSGWINGVLLSVALSCFLIESFDFFSGDYNEWNNKIFGFGHFFMIILYLKHLPVPGKYSVAWNRLGMNIHIKSFLGKSFRFKDVTSMNIQENILMISRKGRKNIELDVSAVKIQDINKLTHIIKKYATINT